MDATAASMLSMELEMVSMVLAAVTGDLLPWRQTPNAR
jgi:hypothetical protein